MAMWYHKMCMKYAIKDLHIHNLENGQG